MTLNQKVGRWLTDSRILKYEAILLERDDLILTLDDSLNPGEFLVGGQSSNPIDHCCLDLIEYQSKVRPDLQETPLRPVRSSLWMVLDGSSRVIEGET
jgi:hypothetical protein